MEKRNGFLTFLMALIPGVGYMYCGLLKKGLEALFIFCVLGSLSDLIYMGDILIPMLMIPIWFYTFFDTFNVARKIDRGEDVPDVGIVFGKTDTSFLNITLTKKKWNIIACFLILIGILSVLNRLLNIFDLYFIERYVRQFVIPVILIVAGIYLLVKNNKRK